MRDWLTKWINELFESPRTLIVALAVVASSISVSLAYFGTNSSRSLVVTFISVLIGVWLFLLFVYLKQEVAESTPMKVERVYEFDSRLRQIAKRGLVIAPICLLAFCIYLVWTLGTINSFSYVAFNGVATSTATPTDTPTATPTDTPTATPADTPTATPTDTPTATPADTPTATPTDTPTATPTDTPTATPTEFSSLPNLEIVNVALATSEDYFRYQIVIENESELDTVATSAKLVWDLGYSSCSIRPTLDSGNSTSEPRRSYYRLSNTIFVQDESFSGDQAISFDASVYSGDPDLDGFAIDADGVYFLPGCGQNYIELEFDIFVPFDRQSVTVVYIDLPNDFFDLIDQPDFFSRFGDQWQSSDKQDLALELCTSDGPVFFFRGYSNLGGYHGGEYQWNGNIASSCW